MPAHGRSTRPPSTDEYGAGGTTSGASGPSRTSVAGRSSSAMPGPLRPNSESSRHRLCVRRRPAPACLASLHRTQPASSAVRRLGHKTRLPTESFPRRSAAIPPGAGTTSSSDARTGLPQANALGVRTCSSQERGANRQLVTRRPRRKPRGARSGPRRQLPRRPSTSLDRPDGLASAGRGMSGGPQARRPRRESRSAI